MGNGQINLFMDHRGDQLSRAYTRSQYFGGPILPIVPSHDLAIEMVELQEFTYLIGIPRSQNDFVAPLSQLLNDGHKEGNMGGIVDIDPDSSGGVQSRLAIGFFNRPLGGWNFHCF